MADNATLPASGTIVATDDVAGVQYQRIKLDLGGDGVSAPVVAALPVCDAQYTPGACSGGTTTSATPGTVLMLCAAGEVTIGGIVGNPASAAVSLMIDITGADPAATAGATTFEIPAGGAFALPRSSAAVKVRSAAASHVFSAWRA